MKRTFIVIPIVFGALVILWILARATGMLQYYSIPTGSNEPTYNVGDHFFTSNLKKPKLLDFIAYNAIDPETGEKQIWTHRLCAMGGDTVLIKDGELYVNGKDVDAALNLNNEYIMPDSEVNMLRNLKGGRYKDIELYGMGERSAVVLDVETVFKYKVHAQRVIYPVGDSEKSINRQMKNAIWKDGTWNVDQFGPVIVPKDAYFVLGDNRHNALDCRYRGFIKVSDWKGTVLR